MQRNSSFPPVIAALAIAFTLQAMAENRRDDLESIITKFVFQQMLPQCNDTCCPAQGFYTYSAFISAAKDFPNFGNAGEFDSRKRELAAFFAHTSHQTKEYCIKEDELGESGPDYCIQSEKWPCSQKKKYYWRGPMHLKWNYNYGPVGESLDLDLLNNPDLVASNATVSFKTAIFKWMTQQSPNPSCHDVMIGNWIPTEIDVSEGRLPGFGVTTNILTHTIDGDVECEFGDNAQQDDRINKYKRFCGLLGVSYGDNLDCNYQPPFSEPNMRLPSKMASFVAAVVWM